MPPGYQELVSRSRHCIASSGYCQLDDFVPPQDAGRHLRQQSRARRARNSGHCSIGSLYSRFYVRIPSSHFPCNAVPRKRNAQCRVSPLRIRCGSNMPLNDRFLELLSLPYGFEFVSGTWNTLDSMDLLGLLLPVNSWRIVARMQAGSYFRSFLSLKPQTLNPRP